MSSSTPNTILLSGDTNPVIRELKAASVAITPGSLVERTSSGTLQRHSTINGNAAKLFALENPYADTSGGSAAVDIAWGTADTVRFLAAKPGEQIYGLLEPGGSVAAATYLVSAGSLGSLQAYVGGTAYPAPARVVAQALETVNNSAGTVAARIKVEVI